jgi:hypothetical protein
MKKLIFLFVITAGFVSCQTSSKTSAPKMLKFNLEKGKGYDYQMVSDLKSEVQDKQSTVRLDGTYSISILDVNGPVTTLGCSYKRIILSMNVMGLPLEFDSDKASPGPVKLDESKKNPAELMQNMMGRIVNKPFILKVNEEGDVLEIDGFDAVLNSMFDTLSLTPEKKSQVLASMKDQFNEDALKDQMAQAFSIYPNKEMKVGDSWKKSYTTVGKIGARYDTEYTVKEIEGDHVTLTTRTKINSDREGTKVTGDQTGNILLDSKTGLMINGEYDQDFIVNTNGMNIKFTGKSKIRGTAR